MIIPKDNDAAQIRAARLKVAKIMTTHDLPQIAPIFERLEAECAVLNQGDKTMDRAAQLLSEG